MCVVYNGKKLGPYVRPPPSAEEVAATAAAKKAKEPVVIDPKRATGRTALMATVGTGTAIGLGSFVPDSGLLSTFALSVWVGSNAVRGVAHALHSPLMSITNAISGMTVVGGMLQLGTSAPQSLAVGAVALSSVNIVGGFIVTKKMLDMFRRPDDPPEYFHYYLIPPIVTTAGYGALAANGMATPTITSALALTSGLACVGGIAAMANQSSSRGAVYLGLGGLGMGVAAAFGSMPVINSTVLMSLGGAAAVGGGVGYALSARIQPTSLPQAVAGFHSLVGLAALFTAYGDLVCEVQCVPIFPPSWTIPIPPKHTNAHVFALRLYCACTLMPVETLSRWW